MRTSQKGIDLIKSFEGFKGQAYKAVSTERYYTIGYGHYGRDVKKDQVISKSGAEILLISDLKKFERKVEKYNKKYNWTQNEFDALVSFAYNIGNIDQLTQRGKRTKEQIAIKITEYCKAGGKRLNGLVARRNVEKDLFLSDKKFNYVLDVDSNYNAKCKIADDCIKGKYGNGKKRKKYIEALGFCYEEIQAIINKKIRGY